MTSHQRKTAVTVLLVLAALGVTGCGPPRDDLRPLVNELVQKQSAHQESLMKQSEHLSEASRQLVESDAEARRELVEFQTTLQTQIEEERHDLDQQRSDIEQERREIAKNRHRDPLIAAALIQGATLVVAALPIVLVLLLVRAARQEPAEVPMGELLIRDLSAEKPILLPIDVQAPCRLEHGSPSCDGGDAPVNN